MSVVGTCLPGGAMGAITAGNGLLLTVAGGCPKGLSVAAWWLLGESPKPGSLE